VGLGRVGKSRIHAVDARDVRQRCSMAMMDVNVSDAHSLLCNSKLIGEVMYQCYSKPGTSHLTMLCTYLNTHPNLPCTPSNAVIMILCLPSLTSRLSLHITLLVVVVATGSFCPPAHGRTMQDAWISSIRKILAAFFTK
jgi:hypothetical protein